MSPVIGRFSQCTEGDPCFAIPDSSRYPSSRKEVFCLFSSALILRALPSFEGLLFVLALPRRFFSPPFGYGLAVFISLQPACWVVLSVGTARGLYLHSLSFLFSPFTFFH